MNKQEFNGYMNYQINFLKENNLWDENWLNKNSTQIGAMLQILYDHKQGKISLQGLIKNLQN